MPGVTASDYLMSTCGCRPLAHGENLAEWMMDFFTKVAGRWAGVRYSTYQGSGMERVHAQRVRG